ncbi:MAG: glycosyltransferase family 2 protein [Actinomycetota bacterium]|nr:glycosyltransferase family 2 protein [Actinomycetota bacterium]MDZ4180690.1 glycosyltransferase family 2 protein [Coriobacteriia bacterium]
MTMPLVTVGIPTYNRAHLIGRALESLLAQKYGNWEAVIVDDGSVDDTTRVLSAYQDERIRVIAHEGNKGITSARNTVLENACGEWVTYLSSDDEFVPHTLSAMMAIPLQRDDAVNYVLANALDVEKGESCIRGVSEGHLDATTQLNGTALYLARRDAIGADRFIEGLNTFESEFHLRVMPRMRRYFIDQVLYLYHTEAEDRVTLSYERGTNAKTYYEQWALVFDTNPEYLVRRHEAGIGNLFPYVIGLFRANGDEYRANAALNLAATHGFETSVADAAPTPVVERTKRAIVRVMRALHLKPAAPVSESRPVVPVDEAGRSRLPGETDQQSRHDE